jgi:flagellar biosynthesis protein FlhF
MRIKKYVADSMPEVLKLVKDDLGPTAVVLNTRTLAKSGILGKKGQVEVTAAVDDNPRTAAPAKKQKAATKAARKTARSAAPAAMPSASPTRQAPPRPGRQDTAPRQPATSRPEPNALARISAQLNELQAKLQNTGTQQTTGLSSEMLPESLGKIAIQMEQDDLDRALAQSVVKELLTDPGEGGYKAIGPLKSKAVRMLADRMAPAKATVVTGKIRTVIALVGTSGAGKTTSTAKLAAHFVAQDKRVALISTDTDRVGGLEQIRAYGSILDLPVDLAYTPDEMREAMQNRRDFDLIIVDTAGVSPIDDTQKQALQDVLREAAPNEIHLVLSAPTGLTQMRDTVSGFKDIGVDRLLFTRCDETARYGAACSVAIESGISVSYVTNSRIVPGDIHEAELTTLSKALFVRSLNGTAGS